MSVQRVLAISADPARLQRMRAALQRAGAEPDVLAAIGASGIADLPHRYVFAAIDGPDQLPPLLARLRDTAHVIAVVPAAGLADYTRLLADPRVNHVVVGDELDAGVTTIAGKLLTGDIFGLEKYLPAGTHVEYARIRDFAGRTKAIETILEYAEAQKMRRQVRSAIGGVCEELLMNALYDAPVDDAGLPIFADTDPKHRAQVRSPRPVSLRYAATATSFAISVRDRFGRLAKNTILAYIDKCLHSPTQIDDKTRGAGLGLYMVASATASYVVNVAYGVATEVVCTFDRTTRSPLRQLGVFVHPGGAEKLRHGPTPEAANAAD